MVFLSYMAVFHVVFYNGFITTDFFNVGLPMTKDQYNFQNGCQFVWKPRFYIVKIINPNNLQSD